MTSRWRSVVPWAPNQNPTSLSNSYIRAGKEPFRIDMSFYKELRLNNLITIFKI